MKKKIISSLLAVCMTLSLTMTACADQEPMEDHFADAMQISSAADRLPFTDISADDSYAEAVRYCYEHGMFAGTTGTTFAPDGVLSRTMLATVFYRMAGSPSNVVMQRLLEKLGFARRGIVHVPEDDDPRLAFEKSGGATGGA